MNLSGFLEWIVSLVRVPVLHCIVSIWCFLADTSPSCSASLQPAPYPDRCRHQRDITCTNEDTKLLHEDWCPSPL